MVNLIFFATGSLLYACFVTVIVFSKDIRVPFLSYDLRASETTKETFVYILLSTSLVLMRITPRLLTLSSCIRERFT